MPLTMPNQYKPLRECHGFSLRCNTNITSTAPLEDIAPQIFKFWKMRKTDQEIVTILNEQYIDTAVYGIGYV